MKNNYSSGIDIGSTTVKLAICNETGKVVFSRYRRHHAKTVDTVCSIIEEVYKALGNITMDLAFTGSAGMGIAETYGIPFIQEVVASAKFIKNTHPDVGTFIEIGGEDSKIIFFDDNLHPDIRMNGNCAGGTGAFIDQMAVLLDISLPEFDTYAKRSRFIYPIASRCGVFAKTDIQSFLSNRVSIEDITASVFHAIALQVIATLAHGCKIRKKILFAGGPLTFFSQLRESFINILNMDRNRDITVCDHPEAIAAIGAALYHDHGDLHFPVEVREFIKFMRSKNVGDHKDTDNRLPSLFNDSVDYYEWEKRHAQHKVERTDVTQLRGNMCFLGIDSGSTTTKMLLMDENRRVALTYYTANDGDPVGSVRRGFDYFQKCCLEAGAEPCIVRSAVTGYGEDLIKAAFNIDEGVVETMAHYRAARFFKEDVSFILDIGGQDMKAVYITDGCVSDVQVNEACSSGCGSFIETFARSLGYGISEFAILACQPNKPFDLGTRCTVFMNSKVKQALREGASVADISAGLAYSVIKNSLHKVLKLRDIETLGEGIVVQGGTFRNPAILRAFEKLLGKDVVRPDISELMGAYGAALTALNSFYLNPMGKSRFPGLAASSSEEENRVKEKTLNCGGCENRCRVSQLVFGENRRYYTGNRCERHFNNTGKTIRQGENLISSKLKLLFDCKKEPDRLPIFTYGIPRALNMYENFPFWSTFLVSCGFKVILSSPSDMKLYEKGVGTIMSDNICFPGKLVHGHIIDLIEKGVDRIFYPIVVYERKEYADTLNNYNCPIVAGYPDVVRSAIDPEGQYNVPIDRPVVSFENVLLLKKQLALFAKSLGVSQKEVYYAVDVALETQKEFKNQLRRLAANTIKNSEKDKNLVVVLCGRPYHIDHLINHGIPELLASYGVNVISEDMISLIEDQNLTDSNILTQWAYTNRILSTVKYVSHTENMEMVQITSFGCGLDAILADEVRDIIIKAGKIYTLIKMDEIANLGAAKIRLRSMLDSIRERSELREGPKRIVSAVKNRGESNCERTIIVPWVSPFYSPLIPIVFKSFSFKVEVLIPQDKSSVEIGLKYVNNDMCYPAIIVIGDIVKAFTSGKYDPRNTSVMLTQTFGPCRASNYLPLTKKALMAAGYGEVPVLSMSAGDAYFQSSLPIDKKSELIKRLGMGLVFSDYLAKMYLATASREVNRGESLSIHKTYLTAMGEKIAAGDFKSLLYILKEAVVSFNQVEVYNNTIPSIGILGEIFVKYNSFSNNNIVEWLISQGIEVKVPSLMEFFMQRFVNEEFNQTVYLKRSIKDKLLVRMLDLYVHHYLSHVEKVMSDFRFYRKSHNLKELAAAASRATSLANQAGEGWLLTAEMIAMLRDGINHIVCLQPFSCLANHITAKGIAKRLKAQYPHLNLLFLDMDSGTSEVNILNRLHFMVVAAREEVDLEAKQIRFG